MNDPFLELLRSQEGLDGIYRAISTINRDTMPEIAAWGLLVGAEVRVNVTADHLGCHICVFEGNLVSNPHLRNATSDQQFERSMGVAKIQVGFAGKSYELFVAIMGVGSRMATATHVAQVIGHLIALNCIKEPDF